MNVFAQFNVKEHDQTHYEIVWGWQLIVWKMILLDLDQMFCFAVLPSFTISIIITFLQLTIGGWVSVWTIIKQLTKIKFEIEDI